MRIPLLLSALSMPVVAFLSQRGSFGPDNKTISDAYPTLLVAAGYAFSIWSVIFLLDIALAASQLKDPAAGSERARRANPALIAAFLLTSTWMIVFSQQLFAVALLVIWLSLALLLYAAVELNRQEGPFGNRWTTLWRWAVGLHAGWVSLAAILNTAQVLTAYELVKTSSPLPWSLLLWALGAVILLTTNHRIRGHWAYAAAAIWGLIGVAVKQFGNDMQGADVSAGVALLLAVVLAAQTLYERRRRHGAALASG